MWQRLGESEVKQLSEVELSKLSAGSQAAAKAAEEAVSCGVG